VKEVRDDILARLNRDETFAQVTLIGDCGRTPRKPAGHISLMASRSTRMRILEAPR
jgi:hypothetical protein